MCVICAGSNCNMYLVGEYLGELGNNAVAPPPTDVLPFCSLSALELPSISLLSLSPALGVIPFRAAPRVNIRNCISRRLAILSKRSIAPSTVPGVRLAGVRPALVARESDGVSGTGVVIIALNDVDSRGIEEDRRRCPFLNET